ncbi:MAG TPA: aspartate--tRNA(Asn) ligase [Candidatus Woesearchaeota archaeon]|nr:aspartate--tRNA(Asn) ligase [Candidatus Woesearchaeota archaeon]
MKISELKEGMENIEIYASVQDTKAIGKIIFLKLRDDSGLVQLTCIEGSDIPFDGIKSIKKEFYVRVKGDVRASKNEGSIEIIPKHIIVVSESSGDLPFKINNEFEKVSQDKRLDWRSLDLRSLRLQSIFKIQSAIVEGITQELFSKGFRISFTPCLLNTASESGSEVFPVIYFDKEAFLRQDPQLHRQLTIAGGAKKIFDLGPAWRAEKSHTKYHLCEHRVCAVECADIEDERDIMRVEESLIVSAINKVNQTCKDELERLNTSICVPKTPFPELTFPEIFSILKESGKETFDSEDLDKEAEQILAKYVKDKYDSDFYFVNRFAFSIKPFYVMRIDDNPKRARSVDLYYKDLELSSGGQREHRYEYLMRNIEEKGVKISEVEWFVKFFKYGVAPHGGFALGIERLTLALTKSENIRDCVLFPRDPERLNP